MKKLFFARIWSILLVWSICFSVCEADPKPIRGGNVDIKNEAIRTVSIQILNLAGTWKHICGGSLISEQDIITAAHCFVRFACDSNITKLPSMFRDLKKEKFRVVIGLKDLNMKDFVPGRGIDKKINRVFIHKDYEKIGNTVINDIAVIRLRQPLNDEDRKINPKNKFGLIPLFRSNDTCTNNCTGREAFGAGFGVINIKADGTMERDGLRKILKVHFTDKRQISYFGYKYVDYIYEAPTAQGFCTGDSGGPIYFKNDNGNSFELVGVISSGPCECDLRLTSGKTSGITFIPEYMQFLESIEMVNESQIRKQMSLEKYEKTGAMFFVLPDHNNIAKLKFFDATKSSGI